MSLESLVPREGRGEEGGGGGGRELFLHVWVPGCEASGWTLNFIAWLWVKTSHWVKLMSMYLETSCWHYDTSVTLYDIIVTLPWHCYDIVTWLVFPFSLLLMWHGNNNWECLYETRCYHAYHMCTHYTLTYNTHTHTRTQEEYKFCYTAVLEFLDSFDHYANFNWDD